MLVVFVKPKPTVLGEVASGAAVKLNDAVVVTAVVVVVLDEGNKFLGILLDDWLTPKANDFVVTAVVVLALTDLLKLKPPLPNSELVVVATLTPNAEGIVVLEELLTEAIGATVVVFTPNVGIAPTELEGEDVNDKFVGSLKPLTILFGESSFLGEEIVKVLELEILKSLALVITGEEETFGIAAGEDAEEIKSNLKPPIFGGVVVVVVIVEDGITLVDDTGFPNENVGVVTVVEVVDDEALIGRGSEVVTGDKTAVTVLVLLPLNTKGSDNVEEVFSLLSLTLNGVTETADVTKLEEDTMLSTEVVIVGILNVTCLSCFVLFGGDNIETNFFSSSFFCLSSSSFFFFSSSSLLFLLANVSVLSLGGSM